MTVGHTAHGFGETCVCPSGEKLSACTRQTIGWWQNGTIYCLVVLIPEVTGFQELHVSPPSVLVAPDTSPLCSRY